MSPNSRSLQRGQWKEKAIHRHHHCDLNLRRKWGTEGAQAGRQKGWGGCLYPLTNRLPALVHFSGYFPERKPSQETPLKDHKGCLSPDCTPQQVHTKPSSGQEPAGPCPALVSARLVLSQPLLLSFLGSFWGFAGPRGALRISTDVSGASDESQGAAKAKWEGPQSALRQPELCFYLPSGLATPGPKTSFERRVPFVEKV